MFIGLAVAIGLSLVDYHKILNFSTLIYGLCIASLVAVLIWGNVVNNARRWIEVPAIGQLQPSEFVKIGLIITFSWYFMKYQEKINQVSTVAIAAVLFAIPAALIFEQPNLSTCLVIMVMVLGIVFASGISYKWIAGTLAVTIPVMATFVYLLLHGMIPIHKGLSGRTYPGLVLSGPVRRGPLSAEQLHHCHRFRPAKGQRAFQHHHSVCQEW